MIKECFLTELYPSIYSNFMNRQIDGIIGRRVRQKDIMLDRNIESLEFRKKENRKKENKIDRYRFTQKNEDLYRNIESQIDRQIDIQTYRQIDRKVKVDRMIDNYYTYID